MQLVSTKFSPHAEYCGFPNAFFSTFKPYIDKEESHLPTEDSFYIELVAAVVCLDVIYGEQFASRNNLTEEAFVYTHFMRRQLDSAIGWINGSIVILDTSDPQKLKIEMPEIAAPSKAIALPGSIFFEGQQRNIITKLEQENRKRLDEFLFEILSNLHGLSQILDGTCSKPHAVNSLRQFVLNPSSELNRDLQHVTTKFIKRWREISTKFNTLVFKLPELDSISPVVTKMFRRILTQLLGTCCLRDSRNSEKMLSQYSTSITRYFSNRHNDDDKSELEKRKGVLIVEDAEITLVKIMQRLNGESPPEPAELLSQCGVLNKTGLLTSRGHRLGNFLHRLFDASNGTPSKFDKLQAKASRWLSLKEFIQGKSLNKSLTKFSEDYSSNNSSSQKEIIKKVFGHIRRHPSALDDGQHVPINVAVHDSADTLSETDQERTVLLIPLLPMSDEEKGISRYAYAIVVLGPGPQSLEIEFRIREARVFCTIISQQTLASFLLASNGTSTHPAYVDEKSTEEFLDEITNTLELNPIPESQASIKSQFQWVREEILKNVQNNKLAFLTNDQNYMDGTVEKERTLTTSINTLITLQRSSGKMMSGISITDLFGDLAPKDQIEEAKPGGRIHRFLNLMVSSKAEIERLAKLIQAVFLSIKTSGSRVKKSDAAKPNETETKISTINKSDIATQHRLAAAICAWLDIYFEQRKKGLMTHIHESRSRTWAESWALRQTEELVQN